MAAAIAAADPAARLALRRHPVILTVILSDLLARTLAIANKADRDVARDVARVIDLVRDIARDIDSDLGASWNLDSDLALARARDLNVDRAHDLTRDLGLARSLDRAFGLARAVDRDLTRDLGLGRDRALVREVAVACERDYPRALDRAVDLAYRAALVVGGALGVRQVDGLATALLDGALDDFTPANLAHADLTGLDLTGVRWSASGTRWPPGTDVDALRARSREAAPGTGIYVIASPGGGKARHHAPTYPRKPSASPPHKRRQC
jgi:hypothetical protein